MNTLILSFPISDLLRNRLEHYKATAAQPLFSLRRQFHSMWNKEYSLCIGMMPVNAMSAVIEKLYSEPAMVADVDPNRVAEVRNA